jgi:hypothetical protein
VVLGVAVGDWALFSPGPFRFCLCESLVLARSSFRIVSMKELLNWFFTMKYLTFQGREIN